MNYSGNISIYNTFIFNFKILIYHQNYFVPKRICESRKFFFTCTLYMYKKSRIDLPRSSSAFYQPAIIVQFMHAIMKSTFIVTVLTRVIYCCFYRSHSFNICICIMHIGFIMIINNCHKSSIIIELQDELKKTLGKYAKT